MGYDAGILSDFGGGNISWWHDYIRKLLALSDEYWLDEIGRCENELEGLQAENEQLKVSFNEESINRQYAEAENEKLKEKARLFLLEIKEVEEALLGLEIEKATNILDQALKGE